jgi:hypothetical protein
LYHLRAVMAVLKRTDVLVQVKREGVQDMRVTGSIPELGSWKPDKAPRLTNVKGNTWEAVVAVPSDELRTFEYKLVEVRNGKVTMEKGNNRLSDAHLVEPQRDVDASGKLSKQRVSDLECSWEGLLVRFIIYHPLDDADALLACSGSHEALGGWLGDPRRMGLGNERTLLTGIKGRCWEATFPAADGDVGNVQYRYCIINAKGNNAVFEREPNRQIAVIPGRSSCLALLT